MHIIKQARFRTLAYFRMLVCCCLINQPDEFMKVAILCQWDGAVPVRRKDLIAFIGKLVFGGSVNHAIGINRPPGNLPVPAAFAFK